MRTGAHDEHVAELVRLRRQQASLRAALVEAVEMADDLADYASGYYLHKRGYEESLPRLRGVVKETRKWVE